LLQSNVDPARTSPRAPADLIEASLIAQLLAARRRADPILTSSPSLF